jgi:cytochrome c-type biogenesis protein CcmH
MMRIGLACLSLLYTATVMAVPQEGELTPEQETRYYSLIGELRCLVCQNETVAESPAPLAQDLREQTRQQILAGRTDREIRDYMTARYGDFVLYRPPFKASTWVLWIGPFVLVLVALGVAAAYARRRPAAEPPPADEKELQRLLQQERKP